MATILITGAAGFVASGMCDALLADPGNEVVAVDNFETGKRNNLPEEHKGRFSFIKCDVNDYRDISGVFFSWKFDVVFHYAALVGVQRTLSNPVRVLADMDGIRNILNLSKNTGVQRVFFSSSSEVYGEPFEIPQNERTTPLNSRLPYAIVKNAGEAWLRAYWKEFKLPYTIFRFFNTYGPRQSEDFVVARFIRAALNHENITVYGDGQQTRTFCFIDDNVNACVNIYRENHLINEVVNIGSDDEITILQLAETVIELTDSRSKIVHLPALPEGDMSRRKPDITKMKSVLKTPMTPLEAGLSQVIDAYKRSLDVRH